MTTFKKGLDYYSFDTDTFQNLSVKRLKRECKTAGIAVYTYLLCELYRVEGYYLHITPDMVFDIAETFVLTEGEVQQIINVCCQVELFHQEIYRQKQILTSEKIQSRYINACQKLRRAKVQLAYELQLAEMPDGKSSCENKQITVETEHEIFSDLSKLSIPSSSVNESPSTTFSPTMRRNEKKREEKKLLPPTPSSDSGGEGDTVAAGENTLRPGLKKQVIEHDSQAATIVLPLPATADSVLRNYTGMVEELQRQKIPVTDINAILRLSGFGIIGHPAWKAIHTVTLSPGKFKLPGKFIISEIRKAGET